MDDVVEIMARARWDRHPDRPLRTWCSLPPAMRKAFEDDAKAEYDALQAAGFQIVPVEPTEAMKREGARSIGKTMGWENHNLRSSDCYRAMLREAAMRK